jgi:hypothetical protein
MRGFYLFIFSAALMLGQKYSGPKPPKPDLPYLVHADNLVPTEASESKPETKRNEVMYTVAGTSSPARTPLAEPIFLMESDKITAQSLELYKVDVKSGHREVTMSQRRARGGPKALRLSVTRLDHNLFRIEVDEEIENGQYALSPNGSNTVFCFEVY